MDINELTDRFTFHPATTAERREAHEDVRALCRDVALELNELVPDGREKSLAITHLEDVMMWANAGIARQK